MLYNKTGTVTGLTLATWGWLANLIVYLIEEFNVKSVDAAQISNVVNGCINLFPIVGAIIADSFFGCFSVIFFSSCIHLLVTTYLILSQCVSIKEKQENLQPHLIFLLAGHDSFRFDRNDHFLQATKV